MLASFNYFKQIESPNMYLCNPDLRPICTLNGRDRHVIIRFNDLSELTFIVDKTKDISEKDFNRIQTKRLIYLEDIGWFQITQAQEITEGDACYKNVTAQSHQIAFQDRGFISEDRAYMFYNPNDPTDRLYESTNAAAMPSVVGQLVQQCGLKLADNLFVEYEPARDYEQWTLIYVPDVLKFKAKNYSQMYVSDDESNVVRHFSDNTSFGYTFMINDVQTAFDIIFDFDFLHHTIKVKTLDEVVIPTDICLSFDNLVNTITLEENSEDITTVLTCEGGDLDITTVNPMGTNYIVDFQYYMKEMDTDGNAYPWMSKELIQAIKDWRVIYDSEVEGYGELVLKLQTLYMEQNDVADDLQFANLRVTDIKEAVDQYVTAENKNSVAQMPIIVEEVETGNKSLSSSSAYYSQAFSESSSIRCYINEPTLRVSGSGASASYTYNFSGSNKTGTPASMISSYIVPPEEGDDPADCYLYFNDGDTSSYCKLVIASEIVAAKDKIGDDGISIAIADGMSGYVEFDEITFRVENNRGDITVYDNDTGVLIPRVTGHTDYFDYDGCRHMVMKTADDFVTIERFYVSGFTRHTVYGMLTGSNGWQVLWEKEALRLEALSKAWQDEIDKVLAEVSVINEKCNIQKYIKAQDDKLYDELYLYWIEGTYTNDNLSADDDTSMADRISLARELMECGETELEKAAQPTFTLTIDAVNFIRLIEYVDFTNQLQLGRTITIEKDDKTFYFPALMAIEFDLDGEDNFVLTLSNAANPSDTAFTIADLLKETSDISRTVNSNWADLTDYSKHKDVINSLIEDPLNRALRTMQEGMSNQQFVIDSTGILGRRYTDDSQTSFQDKQVRLINNLLVFTDDNWKTVKTALGDIEGYGYGLAAEVIIGSFILGDNLQIGSESGKVTIDNNGIVVYDGAISIYSGRDRIFYVDNSGNLQIKGYSTDSDLSDVKQEFTIANGELRSEIEETYATKVSVSSLIEQSSDKILLQVSQTYATQSSLAQLRVKADAIEATVETVEEDYAKKEEGTQGVNRFSYKLTSTAFQLTSNDTVVFDVTGTQAKLFGFTVNDNCIYNGRESLEDSEHTGVYIGTDGISLGLDDEGNPKIYMDSEGNFRALDATIFGNATLADCVIENSFTANNASIASLYATNLYLNSVNFLDSSYTITTGNFGQNTITATVSMTDYLNKTIAITCTNRNGINYSLQKTRSFVINWTGSNGIFGSGSGSITVTIPAGSYRRTATLGGNYNSYTFSFASSNSTTLTFSEDGEEGFIFNGSILPSINNAYSLGDASYAWNSLQVVNINGAPYNNGASDIRLKKDIEQIPAKLAEHIIYGLIPKSYKFINKKTPRTRLGFVAQEVEELLKSLGYTSADIAIVNKSHPELPDSDINNIYSIDYLNLIAPIVKVLQTQNERIEVLENMGK